MRLSCITSLCWTKVIRKRGVDLVALISLALSLLSNIRIIVILLLIVVFRSIVLTIKDNCRRIIVHKLAPVLVSVCHIGRSSLFERFEMWFVVIGKHNLTLVFAFCHSVSVEPYKYIIDAHIIISSVFVLNHLHLCRGLGCSY